MDKQHVDAHFSTALFHDDNGGLSWLELRRRVKSRTKVVARVVFWDAEGQFSLEMRVSELPLDIVEGLILEARDSIKVR